MELFRWRRLPEQTWWKCYWRSDVHLLESWSPPLWRHGLSAHHKLHRLSLFFFHPDQTEKKIIFVFHFLLMPFQYEQIVNPAKKKKWSLETHRAIYSSRQTLKKCRPTTARVKFGARLVKWCTTASTIINSFFKEFVIFPSSSLPVYACSKSLFKTWFMSITGVQSMRNSKCSYFFFCLIQQDLVILTTNRQRKT